MPSIHVDLLQKMLTCCGVWNPAEVANLMRNDPEGWAPVDTILGYDLQVLKKEYGLEEDQVKKLKEIVMMNEDEVDKLLQQQSLKT